MPGEANQDITIHQRRPKPKNLNATKKVDDGEKFDETLDSFLDFLFNAMDRGEDFFELLDPLISDTQCQLHSLVILSVLLKCYNIDEQNYQGLESLSEKDKKILSHAVLFSLLKVEFKDPFGFTVYEISVPNFNAAVLPSKKREKSYVSRAKTMFNSYSVDHIRSVATGSTKEILEECQANSIYPQLKLLPCYANYLAVIDFLKGRKLPIIIALTNIERKLVGKDIKYSIIDREVHFHELRNDGNRYFRKEYPTDSDKKRPTIALYCYSVYNNERHVLPADYDIEDLLLVCAASHTQLPENIEVLPGYEDGEEYARTLYGKHADVSIEYNKHYEIAKRQNLIGVRYSRRVPSSIERTSEDNSFIIERRSEDASFAVDHVILSNYERECQRIKGLDLHAEVDQREVFHFNLKDRPLEASRRFVALRSPRGKLGTELEAAVCRVEDLH